MTKEEKLKIDNMTLYDLCYHWRFGRVGDSLLQGDTGKYFKQKLDELGGFTPKISKSLGWEDK